MTNEPVTLQRVLDVLGVHLDRDVQALTRRMIGSDGDAA